MKQKWLAIAACLWIQQHADFIGYYGQGDWKQLVFRQTLENMEWSQRHKPSKNRSPALRYKLFPCASQNVVL